MPATAAHPVASPAVAARQFGEEIVAVDPRANVVRMFNGTGSRIWQLLDGSRPVQEIAQILADEYGITLQQAAESVEGFLAQLAERDLVEWRQPASLPDAG